MESKSDVARIAVAATKDDIPLRDLGNKALLHGGEGRAATFVVLNEIMNIHFVVLCRISAVLIEWF